MEIIKSVLKKPDTLDLNKDKRVTFSNTVRVFIDDRNKNSLIDNIKTSQLNWIEISIVDKSDTNLSESIVEDSSETDFLVHKVIYDNYILPENDDDLDIHNKTDDDDDSIVFEPELEDGLEFIVHKVTDHEDDLIKKDADYFQENENFPSLNQETESSPQVDQDKKIFVQLDKEREIVENFSKLSIENILQHDKIIAFIDQRNMGLTPLQPSLNKSACESDKNKALSIKSLDNLVLSPPLQELSLEKIVKAHSDNVLCELDISPLNSVQETDSDSDASSEGTMIMMTTEESQKNEQHIRESLLQYQSMKEKIAKPTDQMTEKTIEVEKDTESVNKINDLLNDKHDAAEFSGCQSDFVESEFQVLQNKNVNKTGASSSSSEFLSDNLYNNHAKKTYCSSLPDTEADQKFLQSIHLQILKRTSSENEKHLKQSFSSVEIPHDVRDWKIQLDSLQRNDSGQHQTNTEYFNDKEYDNFECSLPQKSDELENFVQASTERVERIRRRYHIKHKQLTRHGHSKHSHIRGIRPRFGSTAEILDMMQKQNNSPFIAFNGTKNHMSWPCEETNSNSNIERTMFRKQPHFYVSPYYSSECSSQSSIDSYCEDRLNTSCDHCSISSCPSDFLPQQNMPEFRAAAEMDESFDSSNSDSFVYFSMKV